MEKFILIVSLCCIFFYSCNDNVIDPGDYGSDEYEIYKLVSFHISSDSELLAVLSDSTIGEYFDSLYLHGILEKIPGLFDETMSDYAAKNKESVNLKNIPCFEGFVFSSEYIEKGERIVRVWFSSIGFDSRKSQAVITSGQNYGPLAGMGQLIFLKKYGSQWKIEKSIGTWIS